jgi:hypothetical protein
MRIHQLAWPNNGERNLSPGAKRQNAQTQAAFLSNILKFDIFQFRGLLRKTTTNWFFLFCPVCDFKFLIF